MSQQVWYDKHPSLIKTPFKRNILEQSINNRKVRNKFNQTMTDQVGKLTFCFNLSINNVNLNWYNTFFMEDWRGKFKFNQKTCCNPFLTNVFGMFKEWLVTIPAHWCSNFIYVEISSVLFLKKSSLKSYHFYFRPINIHQDTNHINGFTQQFASFKTVIFVHCKRVIYVATNEWTKKELIHCLLCVMCHIGSISAT